MKVSHPPQIKSYLFNMGVLVRPLVSSNAIILTNYKPKLRLKEVSTYVVGAFARYRLNVFVAMAAVICRVE